MPIPANISETVTVVTTTATAKATVAVAAVAVAMVVTMVTVSLIVTMFDHGPMVACSCDGCAVSLILAGLAMPYKY